AEGAARATGCTLSTIDKEAPYEPLKRNDTLLDLFRANMQAVGAQELPAPDRLGSSDIGNVSQVIPAIQPMVQIAPSGTPIHSRAFEAAAVTPLARGATGVHVHAVGKCDGPDFTSAGPHFNPAGRQHGALNPQGAHAGDLPNIEVGADGKGRLESTTELMSLIGGTTSVFDADGSAIVVHAAPDDFRTDPTGNSGARIA